MGSDRSWILFTYDVQVLSIILVRTGVMEIGLKVCMLCWNGHFWDRSDKGLFPL